MPSAASAENSRKGEPGSSRALMRSRGSSLPRSVCLARAFSPPPRADALELGVEIGHLLPQVLGVFTELRAAGIDQGLEQGHGVGSLANR